MSAYIVDRRVIDVLAQFLTDASVSLGSVAYWPPQARDEAALLLGRGFGMPSSTLNLQHAIGRALHLQNCLSIVARYNEDVLEEMGASPVPWVWEHKRVNLDRGTALGVVAGALRNYKYQACETDDWQQTAAFHLCEMIEQEILSQLAGDRWGAEEKDAPYTGAISIMAMATGENGAHRGEGDARLLFKDRLAHLK